ncbi:hypothetical protein ABK040_008470 [Willaertia magna]
MSTEYIKCVVVGDGGVGKTMLLMAYCYGQKCDHVYIPTIFENYNSHIVHNDKVVVLGLFDTAGQEEYDRIRPVSYTFTDVFIIAFSLANDESYANVQTKWLPEIKHYCAKVPYIIVGTKKDILNNKKEVENLKKVGINTIKKEDALRFASKLGCFTYCECSSVTLEGIPDVFKMAVEAAFDGKQKAINPQEKKKCIIL